MSPEELKKLEENGQMDMFKKTKDNQPKLLTESEFIDNLATESRFVSINTKTGGIMITPIADGATLIDMKKDNPDFITQVQKVSDEYIPDKSDNIPVYERLRDLRNKKMLIESIPKDFKDGIDKDAVSLINELKSESQYDADDTDIEEPEKAPDVKPLKSLKKPKM